MSSRSRSIEYGGEVFWFETKKNSKATAAQLELLSVVEDVDLDDLLDEHPTQRQVKERLDIALGKVPNLSDEIARRRERWRQARSHAPACRKCRRQGDSTRHHFVNKWILKELPGYSQTWADRSINCLPLCIECHRDLHDRNGEDKSIVELLNEKERDFAERALSALAEDRPKLLILIGRGEDSVYESRLIKDWMAGRFQEKPVEQELETAA